MTTLITRYKVIRSQIRLRPIRGMDGGRRKSWYKPKTFQITHTSTKRGRNYSYVLTSSILIYKNGRSFALRDIVFSISNCSLCMYIKWPDVITNQKLMINTKQMKWSDINRFQPQIDPVQNRGTFLSTVIFNLFIRHTQYM